ncbi:MAG: hypothetical protein P8O05_10665 [Flavobacteriales bacterium]|nr:hypothetical protein [Flavobacteriales bacterium]MDG2247449.1 hypothetical protein [Flavobacteriales bacterium]
MEILFEQPSWLLAVCAAIAAVLSFLLYRKDRLNKHISTLIRAVLGALRFVVLFLLMLFLLHPLIKSLQNEEEAPLVVVVSDNSESIVLGKDSLYVKGAFQEEMTQLVADLGKEYEVEQYSFGELLSEDYQPTFTEKTTNFSSMMDGLYGRYSNRNIGAVIVVSDGLFNQGSNPIYTNNKIDAPWYTVALGDTSSKRDLLIKEVANNRLAYLGNKFPVEVVLEAKKARGTQTTVSIEHNGSVVYSDAWSLSDDYLLDKKKATLEAKQLGLQKYTVKVKGIDDEVTYSNNSQDIYIDVLESRQKVLIMASSPHPDIAALKSSISSNENYEVETTLAKNFTGNVADYSLVVFHQIPALTKEGSVALDNALKQDVPSLIVLGAATDFNAFNNLQLGYSLNGFSGNTNPIAGVYAEGFPYFQLEESGKSLFRELPPLSVPFGDFQAAPGVVSLINQRVGNIVTEVPLISFNQVNQNKIAVIAGEGIWRWRMVSFLKQKDHSTFDAISTRLVQYMASRNDKRQFRINGKRTLLENERIILDGQLYNASYELINDPEVTVVFSDTDDNDYSFTFGRTGGAYRLDAGLLPTGEYTWKASTLSGGKTLTQEGALSIQPIQLESIATQADHKLLNQLAEMNGGKMVYPSDLLSLKDEIANSGQAVTISYERTQLTDLINLKWILALLLGLLSIEWLTRKRSGSY